MQMIGRNHSNLQVYPSVCSHECDVMKKLKREFSEWFNAEESESKIDELDVTLRGHKILNQSISENFLCNQMLDHKL